MKQKQLHIPGKRLKQYEIVQLIGSGGYCKVYQAVNIQTNENVAIKAVAMSTFKNHGGLVGQLHDTEKQNMKLVNSNYVVRFIDEFQQNKYSYIVMEYCNQGDIEKLWLDNNKHFSEAQTIFYVKQILRGIQDLQKCQVMHRDIKMKNILMHNDQIKLGDLGFSKSKLKFMHLVQQQQSYDIDYWYAWLHGSRSCSIQTILQYGGYFQSRLFDLFNDLWTITFFRLKSLNLFV
ncbi:unnamed protein product [Paramecium sonneborni]|uniref:Protein kinase domain-containing protein n=1 Tax=Paramecium sonneborni TaxID=65129 RepID=A0A8S1MK49_9CILI|nr:unnamed protein product [Paramecium sonneborni]